MYYLLSYFCRYINQIITNLKQITFMRKILLISLLALLAMANVALAQERVVSGTVTLKSDGTSLPGVSVSIKGTTAGATITDLSGHYTIKVPSSNSVLLFTFIGMTSQEVAVGAQSTINVVLVEAATSLNEVVITVPYGSAKRGTFTGSAATVGSGELTRKVTGNISKILDGVAPGIQVTSGSGQPGAGADIRIRGFGSINFSSDPLYVVDGVPYSGNISNISPSDIENVSILKDAASSALYGNKAANGIVMITTKKGIKDRNQISINLSQGFSNRAIPEYDRATPAEYYQLMWEAYRNSLVTGTTALPSDVASKLASGLMPKNAAGMQLYNGKTYGNIKQQLGYNPFNVPDTAIIFQDGSVNPNAQLLWGDDLDWADPLMRLGKRNDYSTTISGGSDKTDYFISVGYLNEKGFIIKSDFERLTGRMNVNTQPRKWLKTGLNLSTTITKSNTANDGSSTGYVNPFFFSRTMGQIYPVYAHDPKTGEYLLDDKGNKIYDLGNMSSLGLPSRASGASVGRHAVAETYYNDNLFKRNALSARPYVEFYFLNDFKFTTNLSIDISNYNATTYDNKIVGDGAPAGRASKTNSLSVSKNFNQLLNYSKLFNLHNVEMLLGHENNKYEYNYFYGFRQGQIVENNTELINYAIINDLTSNSDFYSTEGYFSRFNYNYDGRYFASASYRHDGSSKFATDVRWGNFWSIGAGWRIDEEKFMDQFGWIDMLKLRASYGEVGSDNGIGYYASHTLYSLGYNNANEAGVLYSQLPSPDLLWESNDNSDIALEFNIFDRLSGSVEYYHRKSSNLLFEVPLPLSSGLTSRYKNIGSMVNSGIELHIAADLVKTKDFSWKVDFNATTVKNEVTKLPQAEIISGTKKLMVGHSIYDYWLREYYGVDAADGSALYRANVWSATNCRIFGTDTVTTSANNARYRYAGSAIPDLYGSLANTISYKGFDLSFMLTYQLGGKIYDATYAGIMSAGNYGAALQIDALKRWQKPGDITDVPRMDFGKLTDFGSASDRFLTDASYLNFKSASLGYTFSEKMVKNFKLKNLRVYAMADNIWLFSARKGMNPTQAFSGVTSNAYLPARIITFGVNVTL